MWLHEDVGIHATDVSRAVGAGLTFRPLAETIRGTLDHADTTEAAGLEPEREAAAARRVEGSVASRPWRGSTSCTARPSDSATSTRWVTSTTPSS